LRTLFIVTTAAAIVLSGLFAPSDAVRVISADILMLAIPASLTTLVVYGRGYVRTFCIGGLIPSVAPVTVSVLVIWPHVDVFLGDRSNSFLQEQAKRGLACLVFVLVLTIAMGLLAMAIGYLVESANRADTQ